MKEGKYKTNVKPPYWQCNSCNHRAPYYDFKHGMLWWERFYCPKCKSEEFRDAPKLKLATPPVPIQRIEDKRILTFIYDRMVNFHLENPRYDYMINLKKIIDRK